MWLIALAAATMLLPKVQPADGTIPAGPAAQPPPPTPKAAPEPWPAPRARKTDEPVQVVFTTRSAGFRHEVIPQTWKVMTELASKTNWLKVQTTDTIDEITPDRMARTDVLMFYTTGAIGIDAGVLEQWIRNGGALVGVHCATDTLANDPRYVSLIGGTFDGHPWTQLVAIRIDDPGSAIVAPFLSGANREQAAPRFMIDDEIYQFKSLNPDMKVLLSLAPGQPKMEKDRAYPLCWTRTIGKGRVFYTALGHRPDVWNNEKFQQHVLAGIRWAANAEPPAVGPAAPAQK